MPEIRWAKPIASDECCSEEGCHNNATWRVKLDTPRPSFLLCDDHYAETFDAQD